MNATIVSRREFVKTAAAAGWAVLAGSSLMKNASAAAPSLASRSKIETFDYQNVLLRPGRWQRQYQMSRDFYFGVSNDDILHGFRQAAGLPAPGQNLGGWQARNSAGVFGQWLSGMSRMSRTLGDDALREKCVYLASEWAKTLPADGNARMGHYPFEKLIGGLVDLKLTSNYDDGLPVMKRVTEHAARTLDRTRTPAGPVPWELHSGRPLEWYTLSENLYRAFELTGDEAYKSFAEVWLYPAYWNKFADTADSQDAHGVHAYSHVNTFSGAAMAYAVTGEAQYLRILKNAYDFLQNTQCFATGGYGPVERILPTNGSLGKALEMQMNTCETPCCSWAAFKLAKYLMLFTGDARYGDWIERLLYGGIGAALPITGNGKNFYYADYRVSGGVKYYARSTYTCCSGTYCQATAEYPNLVYFKGAGGLYVNLYLPSEVAWKRDGGDVKVSQRTNYPEGETSTLTVELPQPARFAINLRVPGWSKGASVKINDAAADVKCEPGQWAVVDREWKTGDRVEITIPLPLRYEPIDRWHPERVAIVRGPAVLVMDAAVHEPIPAFPKTSEGLNDFLVAGNPAGTFRMRPPGGERATATFQPFYAVPEVNTYRMYLDLDKLPYVLW